MKNKNKEVRRQIIHILIGLVFISILLLLGRNAMIIFGFFTLIVGSLVINIAFQGKKSFLVKLAKEFERESAEFLGYGYAWYMIGLLLLAIFLTGQSEILAGIFILGISDGLATIVGIHSKNKLPHNPAKTFEGSLAFFISALATYFLIGPLAIPLAFITTLVESSKLPWDDNITIPVVTTILFWVL